MRMMSPVCARGGRPGNERVGRVLAVRDRNGTLRRIDAASTVSGSDDAPSRDPLLRDIADLIALKKKKH